MLASNPGSRTSGATTGPAPGLPPLATVTGHRVGGGPGPPPVVGDVRGLSPAGAGDVGTDLARLTVLSRGRRRDLVVSARVPVVELVPEVASLLGVPATSAWGGHALVSATGRPLDPDTSLLAQGVADGSVLTLVSGADLPGVRVHDDVVEAVAEGVGALGQVWDRNRSEVAHRAGVALMLLLVLVALGSAEMRQPAGSPVPVAAGLTAALLVALGATRARGAGHERTGALVLVSAAAPFAALAGLGAAQGDRLGWPLVGAGGGLVVVGLIGAPAIGTPHWSFLAPVVLGGVVAVIGAGHAALALDPAPVAAVLTVAAVVAGRLVPWLGLSTAGTLPEAAGTGVGVPTAPVRRAVRRAYDVVLGVTAGVAAVVSLAAPLLVGLGWAGLGLVGAAGLLSLLGARRSVLGVDVTVRVIGGGACLLSGTVCALALRPDWAIDLAGVLGAAVVVVLPAGIVSSRPDPRRTVVLDLVEGVALGSLLPLLVSALGLMPLLRALGA